MVELSGVRAGYGPINVLWDISAVFAAGEAAVLIGPNGVGKTTLLRAIMGLVELGAGRISLHGRCIDDLPPWARVDAGMTLISGGRSLFAAMNVEDNLIVGAYAKKYRNEVALRLERIYEMFPRLKERRRQPAGSLSGGEAQMLALARGLMTGADVLLIDEPSSGLDPIAVDRLLAVVARLKSENKTLIIAEQDTRRALAIADRVCLLQAGRIVLSQPAGEVDPHRLHDLYFAC